MIFFKKYTVACKECGNILSKSLKKPLIPTKKHGKLFLGQIVMEKDNINEVARCTAASVIKKNMRISNPKKDNVKMKCVCGCHLGQIEKGSSKFHLEAVKIS